MRTRVHGPEPAAIAGAVTDPAKRSAIAHRHGHAKAARGDHVPKRRAFEHGLKVSQQGNCLMRCPAAQQHRARGKRVPAGREGHLLVVRMKQVHRLWQAHASHHVQSHRGPTPEWLVGMVVRGPSGSSVNRKCDLWELFESLAFSSSNPLAPSITRQASDTEPTWLGKGEERRWRGRCSAGRAAHAESNSGRRPGLEGRSLWLATGRLGDIVSI